MQRQIRVQGKMCVLVALYLPSMCENGTTNLHEAGVSLPLSVCLKVHRTLSE